MAASFERKFREKGLYNLNVKEGETMLEIGIGTGHVTAVTMPMWGCQWRLLPHTTRNG